MASISSLRISGVDYDIVAKSAMAAPSVELTAGADLKIANNIISVNTDGTVGNSADMSFVAGSGTYASGVGAIALGHRTVASGIGSHAEGEYTCVVGNYSHAEGYSALASGNQSHAEGMSTSAVGDCSHAGGSGTLASGNWTFSFGENSIARENNSISLGQENSSFAKWSFTEGAKNLASGIISHVEGYQNSAFGQAAHAEGYLTVASGNASHTEGADTHANGSNSHAEGGSTHANGDVTHAEGYNTSAVGSASHTEGGSTSAVGYASHAEGNYTSAIGDYSHAGGSYTIASGICSYTVGHYTKSYADNSHVANFNNIAVGEATYANNVLDTSRITNNLTSWSAAATTMPASFSSENYFHLYNSNVNTAEFAPYYGAMTVFGMNNTAMGRATMAIGYGNAAITPYSFVAGKGNYTTEYGQTVVGCWRATTGIPSARFIVGGGSSNTSRKNLLEVADNKIYTPCDVYISGDVTSNNHYVNGSISAIDSRPQMTLQYTGQLNAEICYSSTNPKLYFSGENGSDVAQGALVFTYYNTPKRFDTQLQRYNGVGGWFGFSVKDGNDGAVGVVADLYSATSGVFTSLNGNSTVSLISSAKNGNAASARLLNALTGANDLASLSITTAFKTFNNGFTLPTGKIASVSVMCNLIGNQSANANPATFRFNLYSGTTSATRMTSNYDMQIRLPSADKRILPYTYTCYIKNNGTSNITVKFGAQIISDYGVGTVTSLQTRMNYMII